MIYHPDSDPQGDEQKVHATWEPLIHDNLIIKSASIELTNLIRKYSEIVNLRAKQVIAYPQADMRYFYFILDGMVSLAQPLSDGTLVEIAAIGNDGAVGFSTMLGNYIATMEAIVQIPCRAIRISQIDFLHISQENPELQILMSKYMFYLMNFFAQISACNTRHVSMKRLARWLLLANDHARKKSFRISHEYIAMMLGIRRAGVTEAISKLKEMGIVSVFRGKILVTNVDGLHSISCDCYDYILSERKRILG